MRVALTLLCLVGTLSAHRPTSVQTSSGRLVGFRAKVGHHEHVNHFLGIPYAKPPVGAFRFAPPQPLDAASEEELDASRHGPSCYQPAHLKELMSNFLDDAFEMSEDCLTLNVYVPDIPDTGLLPVIVWIPGEGFDYAIPRQFDGSYLAIHSNTIVVTVNYRVSSLGFLTTLTPDAPGNVGLYDQRMALRWIKKNIARFGGNPDKVTIMGRFTGSMSISIHIATPIKEKLFEKAVMQSGIAVGDYVFDSNPLNTTEKLASAVGCSTDSSVDMTTCLRNIPAPELVRATTRIGKFFKPIIDGKLVVEEPLEAVKKGRHQAVDVIIGTNQNEGSLCFLTLQYLKSNFFERLIQNRLTTQDVADMVQFHLRDFNVRDDDVLSKLVQHEYHYQHIKDGLRAQYVQFCGDMYVASHAEQMAHLLAHHKKGSVYVYQFAHRPSFSKQPDFIGAAHGDDVLFALGLVLKQRDLPKSEVLLSIKVAASIGNFALDSDPSIVGARGINLHWPEYTEQGQLVMHFTSGRCAARRSVLNRAVAFWHDIVPLVKISRAVLELPVAEPLSMTSSQVYLFEPSPQSLRAPLTQPVEQSAAYVVVALAVCNVLLLVVSAISITKLRKTAAQVRDLGKAVSSAPQRRTVRLCT
ncbi:acetylcholinesterase [Dermacentor silvarum]|uniref:acetylcholinesterase n=1 Tax=Dermacentor silvarum TaxID=543639 RepID=UPI00189901A1|nr:acetylcholinesterase [Dermacentor silvarum]